MTNQGEHLTSYQLAKIYGGYTEEEIDLLHNLASTLPPSAVVCIEGETIGIEALCITETVDNVIICTSPSFFEIDWLIAKHRLDWTLPTSMPKLKAGGLITGDYRDLRYWNMLGNPAFTFLTEYSWLRVTTLRKMLYDNPL